MKDVVQSLVDDDLVLKDKIGSSVSTCFSQSLKTGIQILFNFCKKQNTTCEAHDFITNQITFLNILLIMQFLVELQQFHCVFWNFNSNSSSHWCMVHLKNSNQFWLSLFFPLLFWNCNFHLQLHIAMDLNRSTLPFVDMATQCVKDVICFPKQSHLFLMFYLILFSLWCGFHRILQVYFWSLPSCAGNQVSLYKNKKLYSLCQFYTNEIQIHMSFAFVVIPDSWGMQTAN